MRWAWTVAHPSHLWHLERSEDGSWASFVLPVFMASSASWRSMPLSFASRNTPDHLLFSTSRLHRRRGLL